VARRLGPEDEDEALVLGGLGGGHRPPRSIPSGSSKGGSNATARAAPLDQIRIPPQIFG